MSQAKPIANNDNLQAALALATMGIPVFPVTPDKQPICKWRTEATTDRARIRSWWRWQPNAMPAFPTGEASGISVLDLDVKDGKDGLAVIRALGLDPFAMSSVIAQTAGGGYHVYFAHKEGWRCSVGQGDMAGVDVRGERGFVVAPGASNQKGRYCLTSGDLPDLPGILGLVGLPLWPADLPVQPRVRVAGVSVGAKPSGLPLTALLSALMAIPLVAREGAFGTDAEWYKVARIIFDETGGSEESCELWHDWSDGWGGYDYHEAQSKWAREDTYEGERSTLWAIISEARKHGWADPDFAAWEEECRLSRIDGPDEAELAEIAALIGKAPEAPDVEEGFGTPIMRNNTPVNNQHNANWYLARSRDAVLSGLRWNEMTGRAEWAKGEVDDADLAKVRTGLELSGLPTINKDLIPPAVRAVASARPYHPIRDRLNAAQHDGKDRLDSWLSRYLGAEDTPYARAVGRAFLIAMVARVMQPGCKADHVLVLQGPQGIGKSTVCRTLAGEGYFSDTLPAIGGGKDTMQHLRGLWVVELSELTPSRKAERQELKQFLTTMVDRYRSPYGRMDEAHPRQCVFIGTTNEDHFLQDATGGRRFWPVACGLIDLAALQRDRDQLMAEATAAYRAGEAWWLERAFEEEHAKPVQDEAYEVHPWQAKIVEWLDSPWPETSFEDKTGKPKNEVVIGDVLASCLGLSSAQMTKAAQMEVAAILKRLGWVKHKNGKGNAVWRRNRYLHLAVVK